MFLSRVHLGSSVATWSLFSKVSAIGCEASTTFSPGTRRPTPTKFLIRDLRCWDDCLDAFRDIDDVYALAADMGGMEFISSHHAAIMRNNSLINLNCIHAASENGVARYLLTSSACVYPFYDQASVDSEPLREASAYPAHPEDAYGWEKLMAERTCGYYATEFGLQSRVVRLHNIYGSYGTYDGGREKAPAALCRKVAEVNSGGKIEI